MHFHVAKVAKKQIKELFYHQKQNNFKKNTFLCDYFKKQCIFVPDY